VLANDNQGDPFDWSYLNHTASFSIVPQAVLNEEQHPGLLSASFLLEYNPTMASFDGWEQGTLIAPPADPAANIFVEECPQASEPQPAGCVASTETTARILVDIASLGGNITVAVDNTASLIDLNFTIDKPGYNPIEVSGADFRFLEETAGGDNQTTTMVANTSQGAIRLHLGDFADTRGEIGFDDLVAFGGAYFSVAGGYNSSSYRLKYDIGFTGNRVWGVLPQADGQIGFEDLNIFATSYYFSAENLLLREIPQTEQGPVQVSPGGSKVDSDKGTPGVGIVNGGTLTGKVGQGEDPLRTGGDP